MRQAYRNKLPNYLDGVMEVYKTLVVDNEGYLSEKITSTGEMIYFESLAIFDRLKIDSEAMGIELSKKLLVPAEENLEINDVVKIDGILYKIYNLNYIVDKRDGFRKIETTLTKFKEKFKED